MDTVEQRLAELGLTLPPPARAVGNYLSHVRSGSLFISVQGPLWGDELRFRVASAATSPSSRARMRPGW